MHVHRDHEHPLVGGSGSGRGVGCGRRQPGGHQVAGVDHGGDREAGDRGGPGPPQAGGQPAESDRQPPWRPPRGPADDPQVGVRSQDHFERLGLRVGHGLVELRQTRHAEFHHARHLELCVRLERGQGGRIARHAPGQPGSERRAAGSEREQPVVAGSLPIDERRRKRDEHARVVARSGDLAALCGRAEDAPDLVGGDASGRGRRAGGRSLHDAVYDARDPSVHVDETGHPDPIPDREAVGLRDGHTHPGEPFLEIDRPAGHDARDGADRLDPMAARGGRAVGAQGIERHQRRLERRERGRLHDFDVVRRRDDELREQELAAAVAGRGGEDDRPNARIDEMVGSLGHEPLVDAQPQPLAHHVEHQSPLLAGVLAALGDHLLVAADLHAHGVVLSAKHPVGVERHGLRQRRRPDQRHAHRVGLESRCEAATVDDAHDLEAAAEADRLPRAIPAGEEHPPCLVTVHPDAHDPQRVAAILDDGAEVAQRDRALDADADAP